jgi:hypothetical protein
MLEILATILTIASVYGVTNDRLRFGWLSGIMGNGCWIVFAAGLESYGLIAVNLVMAVLYLRSIIKGN